MNLRLYDYLSVVTILKNQLIKALIAAAFILFASAFFVACNREINDSEEVNSTEPLSYDLNEIKAAGELRALVDNSSTSYFVYRGTPMGYEYELLLEFTASIGVDLKVVPIKNLDGIVDSLIGFKGDVIAANLTLTKDRAERVAFSSSLLHSEQVLIQRNKAVRDSGSVFVESSVELKARVFMFENGPLFTKDF